MNHAAVAGIDLRARLLDNAACAVFAVRDGRGLVGLAYTTMIDFRAIPIAAAEEER